MSLAATSFGGTPRTEPVLQLKRVVERRPFGVEGLPPQAEKPSHFGATVAGR
jgi:hypothetical protein